jgi:DNA-directed RNA polymerase subunit RPC12/RpoP
MAKCSRCGNTIFVPWETLLRGAAVVCEACTPIVAEERRNKARVILDEELGPDKGKKGGK